jgi:aspartyl-tRNA(Asn)/glutamyl-tRNA(Gln) amidotransferase subunit A
MSDMPLTITDAAVALRAGELSSVELTPTLLDRADRLDPSLGVYLKRMDASALGEAAQADADFARGVDRGPLQGIPLGIKDIIATDNAPTTAQSLILDPTWGDRCDAPVIARLRAAGAVITGKTSTMEFATGLPDAAKPFPVPRNPWNTDHWPGGSSSGTGAGVAAGLFLGGLGTDTGGSIRGPAAYCAISGLKQTFGRVPKSGCVPLGYSLDHIGPMARSARDCALMLQVIAGYDANDPTCQDVPVPDYLEALVGNVAGMKIGIEREHHTRVNGVLPEAIDAFEQAIGVLEGAGASTLEVSIPHYDEITFAGRVCSRSEAAAYHMVDLQSRWTDYGVHTRAAVASGGMYSASDVVQAQRVRQYGKRVVRELMRPFDALIMLSRGTAAPAIDGLTFESYSKAPSFTSIWNSLGLPALCIPMGFSSAGLPLSLQIVGKPFDEASVLRIGDAFQHLTDWHLRVPAMAAPSAERIPEAAGVR